MLHSEGTNGEDRYLPLLFAKPRLGAVIRPGDNLRVCLYGVTFGSESYCPHCEFKGYKKPDADDLALYEQAHQRFEDERPGLNLPEQEIPVGLATTIEHDLPSLGFRIWTDLFNERQLLLLAHLRDAILTVKHENAREYLLLAWDAAINTNSMLCRYNPIGHCSIVVAERLF